MSKILKSSENKTRYAIQYFNEKGAYHRLDGPALEYLSGSKEWFKDGLRHRLYGPAIEAQNGDKEYYKNGKLHRIDGPAIIRINGSKEWYFDGKLHRIDGPAYEWKDYKEWYYQGERINCKSQEEFERIIKLRYLW